MASYRRTLVCATTVTTATTAATASVTTATTTATPMKNEVDVFKVTFSARAHLQEENGEAAAKPINSVLLSKEKRV